MTEQPGFKAFEKRIKELIDTTGEISPAAMLSLLRRADSNPSFDIKKEIERLRASSRDTKDE